MLRKAVATFAAVLLTASFAGAAQDSGAGSAPGKQGSAQSTTGKKKSTKKHKKSTKKHHKKTATGSPSNGSSAPK
jgi:hypothetical protein